MQRRTSALLVAALLLNGCQAAGTASDIADVKAASAVSGADLSIRQLRAGIWLHTSHHTFPDGSRYPSNGLIVREGDSLLLIDPAWGAAATRELLARIRSAIGLPVRRAIATHSHEDRTDGVDVLRSAGVEVLAHPRTLELSAAQGRPVPQKALSGLDQRGATVTVGTVEVLYPGHGHAPDNIMVWLPAQRVLYGGCAIRELASTTLGNTQDADPPSWREAVRLAQARYPGAEVVVPGHGAPGGAELLAHMLRLLEPAR